MNNHDELMGMYTYKAKEFIIKWHVVPSVHLTDIVRSVMMHRDGVQTGGHFVTAICNNDLYEAVGRADSTCLQYIRLIVSAFLYAHINNVEHV